MATLRRDAREPGLPSLNESRAERRRALVLGKARMPGIPLHFWLWTAVVLSASGIVYWRLAQGALEAARSKVMAKQRAMSVALGPKLFPFRDKAEGWVRELSAPWSEPMVAPEADLEKVRSAGTIYLRLRLSQAKSVREVRKAAKDSLRDGFTSCLFVTQPKADPTSGPRCRTIGDCAAGLLCNEWNTCAEATQPYNMRLVYRTLRVLSSEWTDEVHEASSELALSAYDRDLENVARRDVPVTVDLLARSKFFTLVLDEDPSGPLPPEVVDGGESVEERVQRSEHFARVGVWDIASGVPLLRLRGPAAGEVVSIGGRPIADPVTLAAQQRQVNSCGLALQVRQALETRQVPVAPQAAP